MSTSDEREADRTLHGTHLWSIRLGPALVGLVGIIMLGVAIFIAGRCQR